MDFCGKIADLNLVMEWRYYNDGKAWLCKLLNKKNNMGWLSVWSTGFRLTFYFPDKVIDGVYELDIDNEIKETAKSAKPVGKSHPIIIAMNNSKKIKDAIKILEYKMGRSPAP